MLLVDCPELFIWSPKHLVPDWMAKEGKYLTIYIGSHAPVLDFEKDHLDLLGVKSIAELDYHLYRSIDDHAKGGDREYMGVFDFEFNTSQVSKRCRLLNYRDLPDWDSKKFYTAYIQKKLPGDYQKYLEKSVGKRSEVLRCQI